MLKFTCLFALCGFCSSLIFAQQPAANKPSIDGTAVNEWISLGQELLISNDGAYFAYNITNQPVNSQTLVIQSTNNHWKKEFSGALSPFFSKDSKLAIFMVADTLCIWQLKTGKARYLNGVTGYKKFQGSEREWLAYQLRSNSPQLVLLDLKTGQEWHFNEVIDYAFGNKGNALLLKTISKVKDITTTTLQWVTIPGGTSTVLCTSQGQDSVIGSYTLDESGTQVAFTIQEKKGDTSANSIWYFKRGMDNAELKVNELSPGIKPACTITDAVPRFSKDGRYIFFDLQPPPPPQPKPNAVKVDIWNYKDSVLQCTQLFPEQVIYTAVISVNGNQVICPEQEYEKIINYPTSGDFVITECDKGDDRFWLKDTAGRKSTYWLVSLKNGSRTPVKITGTGSCYFSPGGNYFVYYDSQAAPDYFCYDLQTGRTSNISTLVPKGLLNAENEYRKENSERHPFSPVGIGGWLANDAGLFVYDNYDIWLLDPAGIKPPVNITNGYGRKNHIKFRLVYENDPQPANKPLLLTAFNTTNKYNGFYNTSIDQKGEPQLLTMGPYTFFYYIGKQVTVDHEFTTGMQPLKAQASNAWIVKRQSATEAPNYWFTENFKQYHPLTNLQPHKAYNWLTAELVSWQQLDGTTSQGVLYKPENFDPNKKYPVLFNYYQQLSARLYQYPSAEFTGSNINIPWFVSRGYLVFTPDIYYTPGQSGKSTYNTIISAAQWLSKLPYVDAEHMGINGHSVGGFETNYLVTQTNIFAAALAGAGVSDYISSALQLWGRTGTIRGSRLSGYENSQGASLWEAPDRYLENSPIMNAHRITTPLIIFHSKNDTAVPWEQAVELFIAMRRLNKKVWILQYDDGNHGVWGADAVDFTIRITQFFDHYLKGAPPPIWMTQGIPARLKGIATGYELDTSGALP